MNSTHPASTTTCAARAAQCPMHAMLAAADADRHEQGDTLTPQTELVLPQHRRVVAQIVDTADQQRELQLYCGELEVSFDEPGLFAFGQALAQQSRFAAGAATGWGPSYDWATVRPLLAELLAAGVLQRASDRSEPATRGHDHGGSRAAPLPPGPAREPRLWNDTAGCAQLMRELTGRELEIGWLEMVLPVFRVAHAALDIEGRQIGEANVFPKPLRLDVATNWRGCIYAGTRYQGERPMNVSALKTMRAHWLPMMAVLAQVRASYLRRYPQYRSGWTVGGLERLATCVLALPTFLLMRAEAPLRNGELHPVLSCLFRVTDGLRMTMHQMLFVPIDEPTLKPDAPIGRAGILAYAERNYSFHSEHGVCAGPQAMIEQFLAVLVDGESAGAVDLEPALQQALDAIEPAIDYALHGLRAHAAVFTLWPLMARSYERLHAVAQGWAQHGGAAVRRLEAALQAHVAGIRQGTYLAHEQWRADREAVYVDMYAQCGLGLVARGLHGDEESLTEQLMPMLSCVHAEADAALESWLQQTLGRGDGSDGADVRRLRDALMVFLLQLQAVLRVAGEAQWQLNRVLGRAQPQRAFDADDLDIANLLQGRGPRRVPYLVSEFEALLRLRVHVDADAIRVAGLPPANDDPDTDAPPGGAARHTDSTGMVPDGTHAFRMQA